MFLFLNHIFHKHRASAAILIVVIGLAIIGGLMIIIGLGLMSGLTGNNSGSEGTSGGICDTVPAKYQSIFSNAAKDNIPAALLAAIFYTEHGNVESYKVGYSPTSAKNDKWPEKNGDPEAITRWQTSSKAAMGPMQFTTDTWNEYGIDGNGDGTKDIQNIVDTAYSTSNMLQKNYNSNSGSHEEKLRKAIARYNPGAGSWDNSWYVTQVWTDYQKFTCAGAGGACSTAIINQAAKYAGIPYSQAVHCGPSTTGPEGLRAVDCSGFISRVYRDLGLFPQGTCLTTRSIPGDSNLEEISASEVKTGDLVLSCCPGHVVIYLSGDVTNQFKVWQSGGSGRGEVRESQRKARQNQTYFRAKKCQ